jgi:hypothetical protein
LFRQSKIKSYAAVRPKRKQDLRICKAVRQLSGYGPNKATSRL